jgi:signal transduction histidine kinase
MPMHDLSSEAPRVIDAALGRERTYDDGTLPAGVPRPDQTAVRAYLSELVNAIDGDHGERANADNDADADAATSPTPWRVPMPGAQGLGRAWHSAGGSAGDLARETIRLGQSLRAALDHLGLLTPARDRRLMIMSGEATARAVEAHSSAAISRRDGWLSFYTHELRNPLNTLVNAMWILRNQIETPQGQKVCDMAERGLKKIEGLIKDVRDLEKKAAADAPRKI